MNQTDELIDYLLQMGDSALITGQRLCELCGHAPAIEEELALMNVGLDLVGQARNWLEYAAELLNDGRNADRLAFLRGEHLYRNLLLVEQPNGDYAQTCVRQFLYDAWHFHRLQGLQNSSDKMVAAIANKALKEVTYHLRRSSEWMLRLGDGTDYSHQRMQSALDQLWRFTHELCTVSDREQRQYQVGLSSDPQLQVNAWRETVEGILARATLKLPPPARYFYLSGIEGRHTENLGPLLATMQSLPRAYPDARW
ncbi:MULTISPECIES: 1,2-phenylacetyl-CoA epoxidase subunit PaaC [Pseudomonas]|uniref:1,2-phenylacetyl-CoA epoxidase subunit PaaC n=1 Tax=Pseudomonas TaxID=286 RepID=UPI001013B7AB|nr:1,2-phenylacetyl-CoA epoxidase subunit PaaC [Pseudomonas sp. ACM7]QAY90439.1 phenylacetate-CoA oxygenase subunit PaaI [Pseudomonas sp. ACM7]